jgi:hypothetical protein
MPDSPAKPQIDPIVAQDLARLALDLSHDKKWRKQFGKLVKEAKPESQHAAAFNDIELEDKFEAFRSEQEKKEIEREQRAIVDRMNGQRQRLLTGGDDGGGRKYSEDDVKKIEALMEKKGLTDYDDAAILYAATLPPTNTKPENQPTPQGATWEMPEFAEFAKDPNKAARSRAYQVIDEFRRKRA